jgi:hypothetical protein
MVQGGVVVSPASVGQDMMIKRELLAPRGTAAYEPSKLQVTFKLFRDSHLRPFISVAQRTIVSYAWKWQPIGGSNF